MIKIDQKSRKYRGQNIKNSKCQKCLKLTEKQGNTGKKLFFPQNVKIPEIRKFTTNWHPCTSGCSYKLNHIIHYEQYVEYLVALLTETYHLLKPLNTVT